MDSHIAYLLLGSNMGHAKLNLINAVEALKKIPLTIQSVSSIYQTKAWGKTDQADFLNAALCIETILEPAQLLDELLAIEQEMGRTRDEKWAERIIDIDILFYDSIEFNSPHLKIPHPQIPFRKFTLIPLNQLAPDLKYPGKAQTIQELLIACSDELSVIEVDKSWL